MRYNRRNSSRGWSRARPKPRGSKPKQEVHNLMINDRANSQHSSKSLSFKEEDLPTITQLIAEVNSLKKLIVNIRSQTRMLHTGLHQPLDSAVWQSLHHVTHKQISYINKAEVKMLLLKKMLVNIMLVKKKVQPQSLAGPKSLHFRLIKRPKLTDQELELIGDDFPF